MPTQNTNYHFNDINKSDDESDYEYQGETYRSLKDQSSGRAVIIGSGNSAYARLFKSASNKHTEIVLAPIDNDEVDLEEAEMKQIFFNTLYPHLHTSYHEDEYNNYRLILPYLPGQAFANLVIQTESEQIAVFLSAIKILRACHQKNMIYCDLHRNNILFDNQSGESFLIDGGTHVYHGERLPFAFNSGEHFDHLAPECYEPGTLATEEIDIYALGVTMEEVLEKSSAAPIAGIYSLINACQNPDAKQRPTLNILEQQLLELVKLQTVPQEWRKFEENEAQQVIKNELERINTFSVIYSQNTPIEVDGYLLILLNNLTKQTILTSKRLSKAYEILNGGQTHPDVADALKNKNLEIKEKADARKNYVSCLTTLSSINFAHHFSVFNDEAKKYTSEPHATIASTFCKNLKKISEDFLFKGTPHSQAYRDFKASYMSLCAQANTNLPAKPWDKLIDLAIKEFFLADIGMFYLERTVQASIKKMQHENDARLPLAQQFLQDILNTKNDFFESNKTIKESQQDLKNSYDLMLKNGAQIFNKEKWIDSFANRLSLFSPKPSVNKEIIQPADTNTTNATNQP